jgi:hypothetical protein
MTTIQHLCARNDVNGNPQRLYVLSVDGERIAAWNEGYLGHHAVPGIWRSTAYSAERIDCSVALYRKLLRTLPSPDWAHDVPGYAHLRELV